MTERRVTVLVQIQPNASRNSIVGMSGDVLRLKVAAPPVEGKANQELIKFLSKYLHIRKSDISIEKGLTGRIKTVTIYGIEHDQLAKLLEGTPRL